MTVTIRLRDNGSGTFDVRLSDSSGGLGAGTVLFPGRSSPVRKRRAAKTMTKQG